MTTPDLAELSDAALVAAVRNGDSTAFKTLYRRHRGAVRREVAGVLTDPDRIDDTVQETFLRVLQRIGDLTEPTSVVTFVGDSPATPPSKWPTPRWPTRTRPARCSKSSPRSASS